MCFATTRTRSRGQFIEFLLIWFDKVIQIHERSKFNTEIGAGIALASNVTRILDVFGMDEANLYPVETKIVSV